MATLAGHQSHSVRPQRVLNLFHNWSSITDAVCFSTAHF